MDKANGLRSLSLKIRNNVEGIVKATQRAQIDNGKYLRPSMAMDSPEIRKRFLIEAHKLVIK